jgi:hypothetical protein
MTRKTNLDDAIDRVARSITAVEPAPDFSARVLARLELRAPARRPWVFATAAAAVVVALVGASVWLRTDARPEATSTIAAVTPRPDALAAAQATDAAPAQATTTTPRRHVSARPPEFKSSLQGLPPLEAVEAITQDSIQPTKLSIPQLKVDAIVMPPVDGDGSIR